VKNLFFLLCASPLLSAFGQGEIRFETYLPALVDAPVTAIDTRPLLGPGPAFSAQLFLTDAQGNVTNALTPATTFRDAGLGKDSILDRYVEPVNITVPNHPPGTSVFLVMRAWPTSLGSYEAAAGSCDRGQSIPFKITLGGGDLPPAPLITLQAFTMGGLCYSRPMFTGITQTNGQVVITADRTTDNTRLLATTNLHAWINLNVTGLFISPHKRTFTVAASQLHHEYYRLEEP
jgi:hypothetical protein